MHAGSGKAKIDVVVVVIIIISNNAPLVKQKQGLAAFWSHQDR